MPRPHEELKANAIKWLREAGFSRSEIELEVRILSGEDPEHKTRGSYKIDVIGRKDGMKIAIECGGSQIKKLNDIEGYFNKIYIFPYGGKPFQWKTGLDICQGCGNIIKAF